MVTFFGIVTALVVVVAACAPGEQAAPTPAPKAPAAATPAPATPAPAAPAAATPAPATPAAPAAATPAPATPAATPAVKAPAATPAVATPPGPQLTQQFAFSLATGGTAGTYYPFGGAMAALWSRHVQNMQVTAETTGASVENVRLLGTGQVEMALVQNDIVDYAANGTEMFKDQRVQNIRAVAALYPELLQWVVTPGINSIQDLRGRPFVVGPAGSGTEANTRQVLEANGLSFNDLGRTVRLSFAEAANAMRDRQVEGFAVTGGVPTAAITDVATTLDVRILGIEGEAARRVMDQYGFFVEATIPANAYRGVTQDTPTIAVQAILVAREDIDPDAIYWITKVLVEQQQELAQAHAKGRDVSRETITQGITIPFHEGAERYYRDAGIQIQR
jgi:uncharacterized protein